MNKDTKLCSDCGVSKPLDEYYKNVNHFRGRCKECMAIREGRGRLLERKKHLKEGLMRCYKCNDILPLSEFANRKNGTRKSGNCKKCISKYQKEYKKKLNGVRYDSYYTHLAIKRFGVSKESITPDIIQLLRLEQEIKKKLRIYFDNKEFKSEMALARYLKKTYNVPIHTTVSRLANGYSTEECLILSSEFRSIHNSNGPIKVTNVKTGETTVYVNKSACSKSEHLCLEKINNCLDTGEIRTPYNNSKNLNHLKIEKL